MPSNALLFKVIFILFGIQCMTCCSSCCGDSICISTELALMEIDHVDNGGTAPVPITVDSVSAMAYAIQVKYFGRELEGLCNHSLNNFLTSLSNKCYALSCPKDVYLSPDTIRQVIIYSSADFDQTHPAGTDLMEYFVEKTITQLPSSASHLDWFWPELKVVNYLLFAMPSSEMSQRFYIDVHLTNGRVLSDSTNHIVLKI